MDLDKLKEALVEGLYVSYMSRKEELVCLKDNADAVGLDTRLLSARIDELSVFARQVKDNIKSAFDMDLSEFERSKYAWAIPDEKDMGR